LYQPCLFSLETIHGSAGIFYWCLFLIILAAGDAFNLFITTLIQKIKKGTKPTIAACNEIAWSTFCNAMTVYELRVFFNFFYYLL
jgi:hypothetical protein